jgi:hypothetical protein
MLLLFCLDRDFDSPSAMLFARIFSALVVRLLFVLLAWLPCCLVDDPAQQLVHRQVVQLGG